MELFYKACYVSNHLDLKAFRQANSEGLKSFTSQELYYQFDTTRFIYLVSYGVVVFSNFKDEEIEDYLKDLSGFGTTWEKEPLQDSLKVHFIENGPMIIGFDEISIGRFDHDVNKTIMLNLAQSVTLDYYDSVTQKLLGTIKSHTGFMRAKGRINLSKKRALKFIGETLETKNNIAQNLYILDIPEMAWEDEYLDKLHKGLINHFELNQRYRAIGSTIKIMEDNLTIFISYNDHRESSKLEWIIIILIVIEVLDTFISKIW
ncbi:MAG: RMD1 family protein [Cyclobacteriaceae bacterium]|nr:RMD1 family protein [Cyclobacteriaceae bacterium]